MKNNPHPYRSPACGRGVFRQFLNLALFFGYHVLWPTGFTGSFDWPSALIALTAAIALFYFKRDVIHVIAGCAVVGLVLEILIGCDAGSTP